MGLCQRAVGISTRSGLSRDIDKFGALHSSRRTAAIASLKVGSSLRYQAADLGRRQATKVGSAAQSVTSENIPNSVGVIRAMARSDHCRPVSTSRWARHSWNVVSTDQRGTNQARISNGVAAVSVQRNACGSRTPVGSRVSTQRIGAGGNPA